MSVISMAFCRYLSSFAAFSTLCQTATAQAAPDIFEVKVAHLDPEDAVWDHRRGLLYQSNLYRARVAVSAENGHKYEVSIPGISSDAAQTPYELAGLSLENRHNPSRLYGVAKDHSAFTFTHQSVRGPNKFIAFDLPLSADSKPLWQVDLNPIQSEFEGKCGRWPFAPVDSAQDLFGNSYIIFALGAPAIAKVTPKGQVSIFACEQPNEVIQHRPGYTGITFIPAADKLITFGGPRPLTAFDLSSATPAKPQPVKINGKPLPKWGHAEKINAITSLDGREDLLLATNAPYIYSFRSTDRWTTAEYRTFTRPELRNNSLTTVTELVFGDRRHAYAAGAYFGKGKFNTRTSWPLYKVDDYMIDWSVGAPANSLDSDIDADGTQSGSSLDSSASLTD